MNWTDEDLNTFVKIISEGSLKDIVIELQDISSYPGGDPRAIPFLEGLCTDKRLTTISIPYMYGEIAYLAAFALCAEKHKLKLDGKIRITTAVPLSVNEAARLAREHEIAVIPAGIMAALQMLADKGKLPPMILELDPAQDNGRIIMPEWLEPRHYDFNTEIEQLFVTLRGRDER